MAYPIFFFFNLMDIKDQILQQLKNIAEQLNSLPQEELSRLLVAVSRLPAPIRKPQAEISAGPTFRKTSSSLCSPAQRRVYLGSGGSKLLKLEDFSYQGVQCDQGCITADGAIVLSRSDDITIKTHGELNGHKDFAGFLHALHNSPATEVEQQISLLSKLNKDIASRTHPKFNRIPVDDTGKILCAPPYYPRSEDTRYYLPADPWQRYLYVLNIDYYTKGRLLIQPEGSWLVLTHGHTLAALPLTKTI